MQRWILMLLFTAGLALISVNAQAASEFNGPTVDPSTRWSEVVFDEIAPRIAKELSRDLIDPAIQDQLLLLSEEQRRAFRSILLTNMSEEEIQARTDVFAIVGSPEDFILMAEDANEQGRSSSIEAGEETLGAPDGWQLYVSVPFYSQNDGNWDWRPLGFGRCGSKIGPLGCHLTCVSMLYAKWGYPQMNPRGLNDWRSGNRSHYAFSDGGCGDLIRLPQALEYQACRRWRYIRNDDLWHELRKGNPVIANTNQYNNNHFVVIFGFDGQRYWVKDPVKDWRSQDQLLADVKNLRVYGY